MAEYYRLGTKKIAGIIKMYCKHFIIRNNSLFGFDGFVFSKRCNAFYSTPNIFRCFLGFRWQIPHRNQPFRR